MVSSRQSPPPRQSPSPPARTASPGSAGSPVIRLRNSHSQLKQPLGAVASPELVLASPASSQLMRPQSRSPPPPPQSAISSTPSYASGTLIAAVAPPSSPSLSLNALTHSHPPHHSQSSSALASFGLSAQSRPSSPPRGRASGSSSPARSIVSETGGLFERDIEFAGSHVLGAHEAVDVAVPPVLSEAAIAITTAPVIEDDALMRRTASAELRKSLIAGGIGQRPGTADEDPHGATTAAERAVFPPSPPSPLPKKGWQSPTYALELAKQETSSPSNSALLDPNTGSPRQPRRSLSPGAQRPTSVPFPAAGYVSPSPLHTPPEQDSTIRRLSFMSYSDLINAERGTTPLDLKNIADSLPPSASPPLARRGREASPLHA